MANATDMVQAYLDAEMAVLAGETVRWRDGRTLTMSNLTEIRRGRAYWERRVDREAGRDSDFAIARFKC